MNILPYKHSYWVPLIIVFLFTSFYEGLDECYELNVTSIEFNIIYIMRKHSCEFGLIKYVTSTL